MPPIVVILLIILVLLAIVVALVFPGNKKDIDEFIGVRYAHRGLHDSEKAENSISAIKAAVDMGFGIEFDIRLSDMAKLFHYNEQYFGRLFKRETGMSFSEYVNYKRVTLAASYLGDDNITNIAFRVGFNSVTYFNRIFKRHFGMTPSEYQKNK